MSEQRGRPRAELDPADRAILRRVAEKIARREAELETLRDELGVAAARAAEAGAGLQAIGDVLGVSKKTVRHLIQRGALQRDPRPDRSPAT